MKVLVGVKRVVDYNVRIRVKPDGSGVLTDGVKMSMNPFDEIAVEEAIRLRERGVATELVAVSIGPQAVQEQLRTALAMGMDRAIHVDTADALQPLEAAQVFKALAEQEQADIVLLGKQAIDDDANQTGQMLAALWGRPQATFASAIEVNGGTARVTREVDAGLEVIDVDLPAVLTTDLRLNEPRYVKLPEMMKAKKKPLDSKPLAELIEGGTPRLELGAVRPPAARGAGIKVNSVEELVTELQGRGLI
ncbi:electron transfer flavoprotein subunit beta/FixA family protein [Immundisolibacter sp.]|uniref:electron transfer flavoprotein subunit beta/FixA family protein n=1 Tax=Immundisolibacter sp. TaxID=1934948 RepID=UPI003565385B